MTKNAPSFQFAERVSKMEASSTLAVLQAAERLRASGVEVIDFGAGEPDFPTPDHIKAAAVRALEENFTKYTPAAGTMELKQSIISRLAEDYQVEYAPEEVVAAAGGKQAIFNAMMALLDAGDEVILPAPYWVTFPEIVKFAGGRCVIVDTEANDFLLTAEMVAAHLSPRSKLLIINSPCNPTGRALSPDQFREILDLAVTRDLYVISDECYREFTYEPVKPLCAAQLGSACRQRLLIAGTLSKTYAMTGWRLGYALGPAPWISEMVKIQSHSTSNPSSISQKAAVAALRGPTDCIATMLAEYRRRREVMVAGLNRIPGFRCIEPEGAFYAFPNIKGFIERSGLTGSKEVELELLKQAHVALTNGLAFGSEGYLRISYANSLEVLKRGLQKIDEFVRQYS